MDYGPSNIVLALVGNKSRIEKRADDLYPTLNSSTNPDILKQVDVQDVQKIAKDYGISIVRFISID